MKHVLIVGREGSGKTALIRQLTRELRGCAIDGFLTEELREGQELLGVWLSRLDGRDALLAHRRLDSPHRVGPLKVNVPLLDEAATRVVRRAIDHSLLLFIDEIGPVELCSQTLQQALQEAIINGPRVVATGDIQPLPFLDALKRRKDVELVPLSATTWQPVFEELRARLAALCDEDERVRTLQQQADRICELIVSGDVPEIDIEIQQATLRDAAARLFPEKHALYHLLYESRFRRLWQQFRQGTP